MSVMQRYLANMGQGVDVSSSSLPVGLKLLLHFCVQPIQLLPLHTLPASPNDMLVW